MGDASFDAYLMVDWSANSTPKTGSDSIWIAYGERIDGRIVPVVENAPTRLHARQVVTDRLVDAVRRSRRVLVGFDFPYGYPTGFAAAIGCHDDAGPWRAVWRELARLIADDHRNANNRFVVADDLNQRIGNDPGPFWACPASAATQHLRTTGCVFPYVVGVAELPEYRTVDNRLRSSGRLAHSCWKLFTAGSVGSQALVGIPVLEALRSDPRLEACSRVWPFETGFACPVPANGPFVLHAEIWPGAVDVDRSSHPVKDAAQVLSLVSGFGHSDEQDELTDLFVVPSLDRAEAEVCVAEEGWVLGA